MDTDPPEMGSSEVNAFLTPLAVEGLLSASTQNQVLSALLFLYRELLERDLDLEGFASWRHCGAEGYGRVRLPHALGRKYPHAPVEWGWQNDLHPCAQPRPVGCLQPCRSLATQRTFIGGPAHQTRNDSNLCEPLVIASYLTGA